MEGLETEETRPVILVAVGGADFIGPNSGALTSVGRIINSPMRGKSAAAPLALLSGRMRPDWMFDAMMCRGDSRERASEAARWDGAEEGC